MLAYTHKLIDFFFAEFFGSSCFALEFYLLWNDFLPESFLQMSAVR
jgi:hypothetical protein